MFLRQGFCAGLLALAGFVAMAGPAMGSNTAPASAREGTLVILGGAVRDDHDALWQAVVDAAGGPGSVIVVLAAASEAPDRIGRHAAQMLQHRGAQTELLPIGPRWPGQDAAGARAQAQDPQWVQRVQEADGVFMTGGFQGRLMDMLRPEGQVSPLLRAIQALHARGGVVAGTSAGAAVMSETAIRAFDSPFEALLRPLHAAELGIGFGLTPADTVVDQHFRRQGRVARLVRVLLQSGRTLGLGVDEDSAALVRGGVAQAIGRRGLLLIDTAQAELEQAMPLQVRGVRLSHVGGGDHFDLHHRRLVPAFNRPAVSADTTGGKTDQVLDFDNILGRNALLRAMAHTARGPGQSAVGRAARPGGAVAFEWRLSADAQTRVWGSLAGADHSLEGIRLDIRPVVPDSSASQSPPNASVDGAVNSVVQPAPTRPTTGP